VKNSLGSNWPERTPTLNIEWGQIDPKGNRRVKNKLRFKATVMSSHVGCVLLLLDQTPAPPFGSVFFTALGDLARRTGRCRDSGVPIRCRTWHAPLQRVAISASAKKKLQSNPKKKMCGRNSISEPIDRSLKMMELLYGVQISRKNVYLWNNKVPQLNRRRRVFWLHQNRRTVAPFFLRSVT